MAAKEQWKPVVGYEGQYEVSNTGLVRSIDRKVCGKNGINITKYGNIINPHIIKHGYLRVGLSKDNKRKNFLVHRLVAEAFIPNPNKYPYINHKDENTSNNNVSNIEWCNQSYNMRYSNVAERVAKIRRKAVRQYTLNGEFVAEYKSVTEASKATNTAMLSICSCCKKRHGYSYANGYIWRYADDTSEVVMIYDRRIEQYSLQGEYLRTFKTQSDAARAIGVTPSAIRCCLCGKTKSSGGFIWKKKKT